MKRSTIGRPRALTDEQVKEVLAWHEAVEALKAQRKALKTLSQLASDLGVAPATVYNVIRRGGEFRLPPPEQREANLRHTSSPDGTSDEQ